MAFNNETCIRGQQVKTGLKDAFEYFAYVFSKHRILLFHNAEES